MNIAVLPVKSGYNAVAISDWKHAWKLKSPIFLPPDILVQLEERILLTLGTYCHILSPWRGQFGVLFPWAIWGGTALFMRLASYAEMGVKYPLLYGWIMVFFFGDSVMMLTQMLRQTIHLIRTRFYINTLGYTEWEPPAATRHLWEDLGEKSERECINYYMEKYPELVPYYREMLRKPPPMLFSWAPVGFWEFVIYLFLGGRIDRPAVVIDLGVL